MYTTIKGGLKVAAVCALVTTFFDYIDNDGFSPAKILMVFLAAFAIYEALGFLEKKFNK
tara:strand:+ start:788 stop:964 length:177 start_codon:yes stop_codon:yes gene_type:complete